MLARRQRAILMIYHTIFNPANLAKVEVQGISEELAKLVKDGVDASRSWTRP